MKKHQVTDPVLRRAHPPQERNYSRRQTCVQVTHACIVNKGEICQMDQCNSVTVHRPRMFALPEDVTLVLLGLETITPCHQIWTTLAVLRRMELGETSPHHGYITHSNKHLNFADSEGWPCEKNCQAFATRLDFYDWAVFCESVNVGRLSRKWSIVGQEQDPSGRLPLYNHAASHPNSTAMLCIRTAFSARPRARPSW